MSYLLDTNIRLRTLVTDDPNYQITQDAIASLRRSKERLFIAPQNLIELWSVATRPADKNGLGLSPSEAAAEVDCVPCSGSIVSPSLVISVLY